MGFGLFGVGEEASAFQYDRNAQVTPGKFGGIFFRQGFDHVAIDDQITVFDFDSARIGTVVTVMTEKMGHRLKIAQIIERDYINFVWIAFADGPQHLTTNTSEPVNADTDCHEIVSL